MILMAVLSEAWKYLIFACCPSSLFCVHGFRVAWKHSRDRCKDTGRVCDNGGKISWTSRIIRVTRTPPKVEALNIQHKVEKSTTTRLPALLLSLLEILLLLLELNVSSPLPALPFFPLVMQCFLTSACFLSSSPFLPFSFLD